jgi:hypothetical protein
MHGESLVNGKYIDEARVHEIQQWVTKAEHDLGSAERLASSERPFVGTVAYHRQQAAEKALKAYLTSRDVPFVILEMFSKRTHLTLRK